MSRAERRALVEREAPALPVSRQCRLLAVSRASVYRRRAEISEEDCTIMALIDRQYLARPYYGSRRMAAWLATQGHVVNRKRVRRLMRLAGLVAIHQRPNTSKPAVAHKIYPYRRAGRDRSRYGNRPGYTLADGSGCLAIGVHLSTRSSTTPLGVRGDAQRSDCDAPRKAASSWCGAYTQHANIRVTSPGGTERAEN